MSFISLTDNGTMHGAAWHLDRFEGYVHMEQYIIDVRYNNHTAFVDL